MSTSNKYEDMSAIKALEFAKNRNLLLPDIQREYVWEIDEIERLFESIVDDYPIGSCIFWKTNKTTINKDKPNLYYFIRDFDKKNTKNEKAPEVLNDDSEYYIVLDGQQRITSLNIALFGSYKYYKGGRGRAWNNPKSWLKKELYYNLDFYNKSSEEDEEHPKKRFVFLTNEEAKTGNYYKLNNVLAFNELHEYMRDMISNNFSVECTRDLSRLHQRLHDSSGSGLIHYYSISENSYDEALDIFVRVNSTGRKLSKSDLLFSTLIDGWKEGKENIETLLETMNSKGAGFNFNRDYLMRLCLVLVDADTNLKITSLTRDTISSVRDNWIRINSSLNDLSDMAAILQENIKTINELKEKMIKTAKESPYFDIINSFYGIGEVLTTELLGELGDITRFDNHRQLIAFCGLDPTIIQSGKSINVHGTISKRGNKYARWILFNISQIVVKLGHQCPGHPVYDYYLTKKAEGKHYYENLTACSTKILRMLYTMCKNNTTFKIN